MKLMVGHNAQPADFVTAACGLDPQPADLDPQAADGIMHLTCSGAVGAACHAPERTRRRSPEPAWKVEAAK